VDRYVLLTLPGPPGWDDRLRREAGAEVIRCGSIEELEVRLQSGRRYSAAVVPPELGGLAGRLFVPVVVLTSDFTAADLLEGLERAGAMRIPRRDSLPSFETVTPLDSCGRLVAVCGPGGTGASTVAMSLAQGVEGGLLADFALRANQTVLHGLTDVRWGLFEFLERPCLPDLPVLPGLPYRLLPGLRRSSHWTLVRPAQFDRALDSLQACFDFVVADITAEFDGEAETGSIDIEERNHMARRVVTSADVVVVVGGQGRVGRHGLARVVDDVVRAGMDASRLVPMVNRVRSGSGEAVSEVRLPEVEVGDVAAALAPAVWTHVLPHLERVPVRPEPDHVPVLVTPGSLGSWSEE
jgi:hypothetical protein